MNKKCFICGIEVYINDFLIEFKQEGIETGICKNPSCKNEMWRRFYSPFGIIGVKTHRDLLIKYMEKIKK